MRFSSSAMVSRCLLAMCLGYASSNLGWCQSYGRISTVAGTGIQGYSGDGGPASAAMLNFPQGVAIDSQGNFYFADALNYRIRKVEVAGRVITTVAGNGSGGFKGDSGPATDARLNQPTAIAFDAAGNLYIADLANDRIRRVDRATGIITTFAGGGASLGDGGPATEASLDGPRGIAMDSAGNVYVAEQYTRRIRRIDGTTGIITTFAGTGLSGSTGDGGPAAGATFEAPFGVAVTNTGNILVADHDACRIRLISGATGIITAYAGTGSCSFGGDGGPAALAALNGPTGIASSPNGDVVIADIRNHRIRRIDHNSLVITTIAGNGQGGHDGDGGPATEAEVGDPWAVAVGASGRVLIGGNSDNDIRLVDPYGPPAVIAAVDGTPQGAAVGAAFANSLVAEVKDSSGLLLPGVTVTFTAPGSGPSAILSETTAVTDASGQASIEATANRTPGDYQVIATLQGLSTTFRLMNLPGPPAILTFVQQPVNTPAGNTLKPVTIRLTDGAGNIIAGKNVTIALQGGTATLTGTTVRATDVTGTATYSDLRLTTVGMYQLIGAVDAVTATSSTFQITPATARTIAVVSGDAQTATVGAAYASPVKASVTDSFGNPVSAAAVTFAGPANGAGVTFGGPLTVNTDANGVAASSGLTANSVAGTFQITASTSGAPSPAAFTLTNVAGSASKLSFGQQPTDAVAGKSITPPVTVQIQDSLGNAVHRAGLTVTVTANLLAQLPHAAPGVSSPTDANGVATFGSLTLTQVGTYQLVASAGGAVSAQSNSFHISPGVAASIKAANGTPQTAAVLSPFSIPLEVAIRDASGNPVSGVMVMFTVPASGASATLSSSVAATGANGVASITAIANGVAGAYAVTAAVAGLTGTANFALTNVSGKTSLISFTQQPADTAAGATMKPVVVRLSDGSGNPIAAVPVDLAATGGTGTLVGTTTQITDTNGEAAYPDLSITTTGSYQLRASGSGLSAVSNPFQITPASGVTISALAGSGQAASGTSTYASPLKASVQDVFGNPAAGVTVTFAAPGSGPSVTFGGASTVTTDASGVATSPNLSSNGQPGAVQVTATTEGALAPAIFTLTNQAGSASKLAFVQQPVATTAAQTISPPVTIQLQDSTGSPVAQAGVPVSLTLTPLASRIRSVSGTTTQNTDASGLATFTDLRVTQAGAYQFQATTSGVASAQSNSFQIAAGTASAIQPTGGTPQTTLVSTAFPQNLQASVTDAGGNPIAGVSVVFAAPGSGSSGTFAGGATSVTIATDAQGRAAASIFTANSTPGAYVVTATAAAVTGSASFSLTNQGPAVTGLMFVQQPTNTAAGAVISPAVAVQVQDGAGNPISTSGIAIVLGLIDPAAITGSTLQVTNGAGVAMFGDLRIDAVGTHRFRATSSEQSPAISNSFSIGGGAPAQISPSSGAPQGSAVSQSFATPLQASVQDAAGNPVIGASVSFAAPISGASASFGGSATVLTDASGTATSPPLTANGTAGIYKVTASVQGLASTASFTLANLPLGQSDALRVNPAQLSFTSELNQPAPASQTVSVATSGNAILTWSATSSDTWLQVTPASGVTPGQATLGVNPAGLAAGVYSGIVTFTASPVQQSQVFVTYTIAPPPVLTVNPPLLVFLASSNAAPPLPQTLRITSTSRVIGYRTTAEVDSPPGGTWLRIANGSGQTPAELQVSVVTDSLRPGVYHGSIRFEPQDATVSRIVVPVTLAIGCSQGGCITEPVVLSVVNGASFHPGGSPGAIMSIFGANLSEGTDQALAYPLPKESAGTAVTVNGAAVPLYYVSPTQVNFEMPSGVSGTVDVQVISASASPTAARTAAHPEPLTPTDVGLFVTPDDRASALHQDLTVATPASPFAAGDLVILYVTGQGSVTPPIPDGAAAPASPLSTVDAHVEVSIGGKPAMVVFAGMAPGYAGLAQVNAIVPAGLPPGDQPAFVTIGGTPSNAGMIPVR